MEVGDPIALSLVDRITENIIPVLRGVLGLLIVAVVLILGVRPLIRQIQGSSAAAEPPALDAPPPEIGSEEDLPAVPSSEVAEAPQPAMRTQTPPPPPSEQPMPRNMPGVGNVFNPDIDLAPHEYLETMGIRGRLTKARVDAVREAADQRPEEVLRVASFVVGDGG